LLTEIYGYPRSGFITWIAGFGVGWLRYSYGWLGRVTCEFGRVGSYPDTFALGSAPIFAFTAGSFTDYG